jgi:hypothetical protein
MDKETLSNYGWIVIAVLVLVVMIALATPFGTFVSEAVQSTTKGLFDVNKTALDSTGLINIDNQEFDVPDMNHDATETPVTPEEPAQREGYLGGTWKFNDVLSNPNFEDGYNVDIQFNAKFDTEDEEFTSMVLYNNWIGFAVTYGFDDGTYYDMYYSDQWIGTTDKVITFAYEQQVSTEFYNWFIANATQIG